MNRIQYIWLLLLPAMFVACEKSELQSFSEEVMIYFFKPRNTPTPDSLTYSFAVRDAAVQFDTVKIPLRIIGMAAEEDRAVHYSVIADKSNAEPSSYALLPAVVKANEYATFLQVKVLRSPALKNQEMRLWLQLENSDDFKTGVDDQLKYLVKINDFLSMPASWPSMSSHFGKYSNTKYDLIIKATGRFDYTGVLFTEAEHLKQTSVNYLIAYEEANGPLYDENGDRVFFP